MGRGAWGCHLKGVGKEKGNTENVREEERRLAKEGRDVEDPSVRTVEPPRLRVLSDTDCDHLSPPQEQRQALPAAACRRGLQHRRANPGDAVLACRM